MNRSVVFFIVILSCSLGAVAQRNKNLSGFVRERFPMHAPYLRGNVFFGVNSSATDFSVKFIEGNTYLTGNINLYAGYFVLKNLSAALKLGTGVFHIDEKKVDSRGGFSVGGLLTYHYRYFFINGGYTYRKANINGDYINALLFGDGYYSQINLGLGYEFFVAPHWAIVPSVEYNFNIRESQMPPTPKETSMINLNIGLNYYLSTRARRVNYEFPYENSKSQAVRMRLKKQKKSKKYGNEENENDPVIR